MPTSDATLSNTPTKADHVGARLLGLADELHYLRPAIWIDSDPDRKRKGFQMSVILCLGGLTVAIAGAVAAQVNGWFFVAVMVGAVVGMIGGVGLQRTSTDRAYRLLIQAKDWTLLIGSYVVAVGALVSSGVATIIALATPTGALMVAILIQLAAVRMAWEASDSSRPILRTRARRREWAPWIPTVVMWVSGVVLFGMILAAAAWLDQFVPVASGLVLVFAAPVLLGYSLYRRDIRNRLISLAAVLGEVQAAASACAVQRPGRASQAALASALSRSQVEMAVETHRVLFGFQVGRIVEVEITRVLNWTAFEVAGLTSGTTGDPDPTWKAWLQSQSRIQLLTELATFASELRSQCLNSLARR